MELISSNIKFKKSTISANKLKHIKSIKWCLTTLICLKKKMAKNHRENSIAELQIILTSMEIIARQGLYYDTASKFT